MGAGATYQVAHGIRLLSGVSILTRPWGRVQPSRLWSQPPAPHAVSILTRPWGRVQCDAVRDVVRYARFQSSPARGSGCNRMSHPYTIAARMFQSSPARGSGCNAVLRQDSQSRQGRFNPYPPVGAGATPATGGASDTRCTVFQSSPARGGGCNDFEGLRRRGQSGVSILTRPWGRVQRY